MSHLPPAAFVLEHMLDIPGVKRDASAITLHTETGHLWVVTDEPERLIEFSDSGELVREVQLKGFQDTEGLCHLGGEQFAIAEERKMRITLVEVPAEATEIDDDGPRIEIRAKAKKNKGLEGVTYDAASDMLFTVREDKPPTVYRIQPVRGQRQSSDAAVQPTTDSRAVRGGEPKDFDPNVDEWPLDLQGLDDLSDVFFDPETRWLWLLSHESQAAVAFDRQGTPVAELRLRKGHHGLPEDVEQAEGICRDRTGRLLVCSEPNRVYVFRRELGDGR